jgi:hypothetical protein
MTTLGVYHDNIQYPAAGSLTAGVSVTSTGDKLVFTPNFPARVIRWGIIWDTAPTVTPPVLTLDFRPTAGSNTNRVTGSSSTSTVNGKTVGLDVAGGSITCPAIGSAGALQGQGLRHDVVAAVLAASGYDGFVIFPGQQGVIEVSTAATAGTGWIFLEFETLAFVGDPATPGIGTQSFGTNPIQNITKVFS